MLIQGDGILLEVEKTNVNVDTPLQTIQIQLHTHIPYGSDQPNV